MPSEGYANPERFLLMLLSEFPSHRQLKQKPRAAGDRQSRAPEATPATPVST